MGSLIEKRIKQRQDPRGPEQFSQDVLISQFPSAAYVVTQGENDFEKARVQRSTSLHFDTPQLKEYAQEVLSEMQIIERAARNPSKWNIEPKIAKSIRRVIIFSAPGTYFLMEKPDRHKGHIYAWGMERQRADIAARLGIFLAGIQTNTDLSAFAQDDILDGFDKKLNELRERAKIAVQESGLRFLYVGTPDEVSAIDRVLSLKSSFIPAEAVDIISGDSPGFNTFNQVEVLKDYLSKQSDLRPGTSVAFVMGFQAARTFRYCKQIAAIPSELSVCLFPTRTHEKGIAHYAERETRGALAGMIGGLAVPTTVSYSLIGNRIE